MKAGPPLSPPADVAFRLPRKENCLKSGSTDTTSKTSDRYFWSVSLGLGALPELRRRGVAKFPGSGGSRFARGSGACPDNPAVQQALRNGYFNSLGLPRLHVSSV